ncbi:MAG: peptide chain release factor N(5)-glutamine methyltransferase [Verrucomicrobia bacterium]|jgi:release factor glutamine methyltransferase|nr:peptide chain release factor N(5)-glutamine methyltransferase [Verrucomicrobiota bacterium]MBT7065990.1 peptide chain release factor N(5)-glutamine methyltransferase [Verrucomicrobiota bacterium]MBT7699294.1 peptide chain release factor N(5)-glutamine methyltransferase [Verrucomicrobiota bacterium]
MSNAPATVKHVLESGAAFLGTREIQEARLKCELLAARLLQCPRLELYMRFDHVLSDAHVAAMRRGLKRLAAGEPVQHILGEVEFHGHVYKVDPRALIPRPETELLVEAVLAWEDIGADALVVDVGTGSGCIVISLALARPTLRCIGLDVSTDALALAQENAAARGVEERIAFSSAHLSDCVEPESVAAIVANLPYIASAECESLPQDVREHDPRSALDGGADGLAVIRDVVPDAAIVLRPGGRIFLEIGADQAAAVRGILEAEGFSDVMISQDLAGRDRIAVGTI